MAKKDTNKDGSAKSTIIFPVSGVPVATLEKMDEKIRKLGITRSGYVKNLINQDLKDGK